MNPIAYLDSAGLRTTFLLVRAVDTRWSFFKQEEIIREWTPDFYVGLRNYYLAKREGMIEMQGEYEDLYEDLAEESGEDQ